MSSRGVRPKRTPFDIAIESLRDNNNADIARMKLFSAESSPLSGNVGASSTNSPTPGGSFLPIAGQTPMIGAIAFNPVTVSIVDGSIDIGSSDVPPQKYSSYVLTTGQGTPDDLNYIDNALNNGQLLYYQGTITQIQNIKHASIGTISNIVGTTTVTVTTTIAHNMTTGDRVSIQSTTNFDISKAVITVTGGSTFTYAATGSATPETAGSFQNGNVLTSDGTTVTLDGTTAANAVPWIALLFDPTVLGGGAWRVQFGAGAGGTGITFPIDFPSTDLGTVTTTQTIDFNTTTRHSVKMTIGAASVAIDFSNASSTTTLELSSITVIQDATGSRAITFVPTVINSAVIIAAFAASSPSQGISFIVELENGILTAYLKTGNVVSGGGGDVSLWANFEAVNNVDYATFDGINIDRLRFVVDSGAPASSSDPSIFLGSDAFMNFNIATLDGFRWKANDVEMVKISEVSAGVYRFDMLDHSIVNAQDIRLDDTSGAVVFAGTDPAIGYDSVAARLIINMPTGGNLFVTNNNVIGSLQINNNSIAANIVNANNVLQLGVNVTVPTVEGEFRNDGSDTFVFSGGAVRNLSDIGVAAGGANVFLSNLSSPTSVNQDIIPQSGKLLGSSGNEWSSVFSNNLRFGTAGVISATSLQIFGDANGITFNIPSASADNYDFQAGGVSKMTINDTGTIATSNIVLSNVLTLNDVTSFAGSNGQFYREGSDVKIFSGGVERNVSDIGTGSFLPLIGGTMSGDITMTNNNIFQLDELQITGASGSTLRGTVTGQSGRLELLSNDNGSQVRIIARSGGGTLTRIMTISDTIIDVTSPLVFSTIDTLAAGERGICRDVSGTRINAPTGDLIILSINNTGRFTMADNAWGGQVGDDFRLFCVSSGNKAPINLEPRAGDPTTTQNGDIWYNSTSHKYKGKENGTIVTFTTT